MTGVHALFGFLISIGAFLAGVAIFSRIVSDKDAPSTIKNGAGALARLFNGAFGD